MITRSPIVLTMKEIGFHVLFFQCPALASELQVFEFLREREYLIGCEGVSNFYLFSRLIMDEIC